MFIVNNCTKCTGIRISDTVKLNMLANSNTACGEGEWCQAFLVLFVDLLSKCFLALLSSGSFPLFQAMAVIIDLCNSLQD